MTNEHGETAADYNKPPYARGPYVSYGGDFAPYTAEQDELLRKYLAQTAAANERPLRDGIAESQPANE